MLLLQEFLKTHSLEDLTNQYFIKIKRHTDYPNLVLFKYDQLNSDLNLPLVQECRGIILDETDNWNIVSFPYTKFFNYGEDTRISEIDWRSASVQEKLDGSAINLAWYEKAGEWIISTSGVPGANTPVDTFPFTFKDLFLKTWKELKYPDMKYLNHNYTYMFELLTIYNQVVVNIKESDIVLHGARDMRTYKEVNPSRFASEYGFHSPAIYPLRNMKETLEFANTFSPKEHEGFVIVDLNYNRVKVKSVEYVKAAHMRDSLVSSIRGAIEVYQKGEMAEVLAYLPQYKKMFDDIDAKFKALEYMIAMTYDQFGHIESQKDFALEATKHKFSVILFGIRGKKYATVMEGLNSMTAEKLMNLLNFKAEDIAKYIGV